ncbi:hypothetical protein [Kocuria palustris]|uniref:hypothetical protein n=1 Tax=Kocuria palustris TaxID=71999 RepID=UPI0024699C5F|nr:hypothetical protein [Kocuria palustris]MDH5153032.1 hypothetical protein [Kocuria palustris]
MLRRVLLLVLIMAVPVLTALGTQQLARTTMPPTLPSDPVSTRVTAPSSPDPEASAPAPTTEPEDDDGPDEVDLDTDSDGEQDDVPEAGTVTR